MAYDAASNSASPVVQRKALAERAWQDTAAWDGLYRDAYDFAIPNRKPGSLGTSKRVADSLFDMTAPTSAMHLAGQLQRMLFAQPPALVPGALVKQALTLEGRQGVRKLAMLEREFERTGEFMYPFMEAGDLDTATNEMCTDLGVGQGVLIPLRGTPDQPVIFFAPPQDEVALKGDAYGRVNLASWRRYAERGAIIDAFPEGTFSASFKQQARTSASTEVMLYQDFWKRSDGLWQFAAYVDRECDDFITTEVYRTKPLSTPRYYRVTGEMRGRGPILMALPSIKTLNKAQELALRSAAMQMLGLWGYRASSGFNPDTAALEAGAFFPMQSTGGIMGPDIMRLDPAAGRLDVASLVIEGLQQQIRDAMMDTRLPAETGTPRSASEIAARLKQNGQVHLGAFMRLWREVHPDIVPRVAEILNSFGYLGGLMDFNQLIVSVGVRSPMAAALDADKVANIAHYAEMMTALVGPQKLPEHLDIDKAGDQIADGMMISKGLIPTPDDRQKIRQALQEQQAQAMQAEMATKAAPQVAGGMMRMIEGGKQAA